MIVVVGAGRLGNQLFQLANACRIRRSPRERIFSLGLGEALAATRRRARIYNTDGAIAGRIFDVITRRVLEWLAQLRLVVHVTDDETERGSRSFALIYISGYFQSERFVPNDFRLSLFHRDGLRLAASLIEAARNGRKPFFIHVRHGDYPHAWRLPSSYYSDAIERLARNVDFEEIHFFILGNANLHAMEEFHVLPHKTYSELSPYADLFLMSLCAGGIASNSSFAWWGGYSCRGEYPVFAPKYWLGWREGRWIPNEMISTAFVFVEVGRCS